MTGAQIHLILSRSPILFLLAALILFGLAWKKKQSDWESIALIWITCSCLLVIPTYLTGSSIENSFLTDHEKFAKISLVLAVLTSVLLIVSLTFGHPSVSRWTKKLGLVGAVLTFVALGLTNQHGVLIRHGETNSVSEEKVSSDDLDLDEGDQEDREDPQRGNEV